MIRRFVFFVLFALAVWAGVFMQATQGYVGLNVGGWSIEAPIWLSVIIFIFSSILLVFLLKFIRALMNIKAFFYELRTKRRWAKAKHKTTEGMFAFLEGNWSKAESSLVAGASCIDLPFMNYIFAAKAAAEQAHFAQAQKYWQTAQKLSQPNKEQVAYALIKGELLYQQQHFAEALVLFEEVLEKNTKQVQALKWSYEILSHQKNWEKIIHLVPRLIKAGIILEQKGKAIQKEAYEALFLHAGVDNLAEIKAWWSKMPQDYQADGHLIFLYTQVLWQHHLVDEAESLLRKSLKQEWNQNLIQLYGKLKATYPQKQLAFAETFLKTQPKSALLLLTLGRICVHHQLFGKAQRYFEASLDLSPYPETFAELGELCLKLNKPEVSVTYFREGLLRLTHKGSIA